MPELIGLDFETYGAEDLPTHGLARYARHKTFMPLIGSVAWRRVNGGIIDKKTFDFVHHRAESTQELRGILNPVYICAHNAPFEQAVLANLGLDYPSDKFIDSAVVARAAGAGGRLEAAASQLLDSAKIEQGKQLIKLFSIPGRYQDGNSEKMFDPQVIVDHPQEWASFEYYCEIDAALSLELVERYLGYLTERELKYQAITMDMNRAGWCVDVPRVEEMQRRYKENQDQALFDFRQRHQADELNLNSLKQLKEWCAERGVRATSFDEKHVDRLLSRIQAKLAQPGLTDEQVDRYSAVEDLLATKKILGGSSLKKLQVILDTAAEDPMNSGTHRLWDQYMHCGAGQTLRTTGRSVQMQNLKRLSTIADMSELDDPGSEWDNTKLAENLRQVFTASDPQGRLIVGDFSSVESRGLAWLAREHWKLRAYRQGKDLYRVLASTMFGVDYDSVTKDQRQTGKVGELACGYGAGSGAVVAFAEGMGVYLGEAEAAKLVWDWRDANPMVVALWDQLDKMLHQVVELGIANHLPLDDDLMLRIAPVNTPASLLKQHPGAQSVKLMIDNNHGEPMMYRFFHGCYVRGRNICYYRPSDRKTGDLWRSHFVDPKTKQVRFYELYGGKLAGILTQSFCRELFFESLEQVHEWSIGHGNLTVVGQFHDEIVVDWKPAPAALSLYDSKQQIERLMSDSRRVPSFPLAAEIKDDYRYTK